VVCRSLDIDLSGKVAKKRLDMEKRSPRPQLLALTTEAVSSAVGRPKNFLTCTYSFIFTTYTVSQKIKQNYFCYNYVKLPPNLTIFGKMIANCLKLYEVHSFSTSPNSRQCTSHNLYQCTTVLIADDKAIRPGQAWLDFEKNAANKRYISLPSVLMMLT